MKIKIEYTVDVDVDAYKAEYGDGFAGNDEWRDLIKSQLMEEGMRSFEAIDVRVNLKKW